MIRFKCPCGKLLKANGRYASDKVRCPACRQLVDVPSHERWDEVLSVACPICTTLKAAVEHAGEKVKCPACGRVVRISGAAVRAQIEPPVLQVMNTAQAHN